MTDNKPHQTLRPIIPCAICKKDSVQEFWPFCSKHCADVDLGRWFTGVYKIEIEGDDDPDELEAAFEEIQRLGGKAEE